MSGKPAGSRRVSMGARVCLGILLPVMVFIGYQFALIKSLDGTGSWDGMSLAFGSLFIVPGLYVTNLWVVMNQWARKSEAFIAGMMIPSVIALVEYLWVGDYSYKARTAINHAFIAPFLWIWLFVFMLFTPLIVSIIRAIINGKRR
ncbi:MAG TPA: hypothetical protein VMH34_07050 [Gammaproteobacteria bacterium]|nr:hypothetical protein [Gammaproteobacteria bacterium]